MRRKGSVDASLASIPIVASLGCASSVDVMGVYFPAWLVAFIVAVAASYAISIWLGRRSFAKELADSGLFFVGLVASISLTVWWACFSGF